MLMSTIAERREKGFFYNKSEERDNYNNKFRLKEVTPKNTFFLSTQIKKTPLNFATLKHKFSLENLSPKKPKIRHLCRHYKQNSATRPRFRNVIPSKGICPWLLTSLFWLPFQIMYALEPYYF